MWFKYLILLWLLPISTVAQWKATGIETNISAGIGLHQFSNDSLVFKKRRGQGTLSGQTQVPLLLHLQQQGGRHAIMAGLGYRRDGFAMNKNNVGDAFFSILIIPFGGRPFADSFALQQVKITIHSISIPIGYDYNLTRNPGNAIHFHARAMLLPAFATGRDVRITVDDLNPAVNPPTADELKLLRSHFEQATGSFSLFFSPEIQLTTARKPRKFGFSLGMVPFAFDLIKPTQTFLKGATYLRIQMGIAYHW